MQPVPILAVLLARLVTLLLLMATSLALPLAFPALAAESSYTRHDYESCAKRPSPHPDVVDIRQCKGLAGIPVVWTAEPDASSVDFGRATSATIPLLDSFHEAGRTIEWRGSKVNGAVKPLAAITRYATGPSIGKLGKSRLVIHRLMPNGASCVMGVVAGSNEAARALVDAHAAAFVCGRSTVIVRS